MWSLVQVGEIPPRPIVVVGGLWQRTLAAFMTEEYIQPAHRELITLVRTADEAVKSIVNQLIG
jgi:predicted Rossmann-fold nucleotide-binding protein